MTTSSFCKESTNLSNYVKMYASESDCIFSKSSFCLSATNNCENSTIMSPPLSANSNHFQAPNCNLKSYQNSYIDFTLPTMQCPDISSYTFLAETPNSLYGDCVDEQQKCSNVGNNSNTHLNAKEDIFRFEPEDIARLTDQCDFVTITTAETPQMPYTPSYTATASASCSVSSVYSSTNDQLTTAKIQNCTPAAMPPSTTETDCLNLDIEYFNYDEINCQSKNQSPCSSPPLDPWMTLSLNDGGGLQQQHQQQQQNQQTHQSFSPKRSNNYDYQNFESTHTNFYAKLPSMMTTFGTPKYEPISGISYNNYIEQMPQNIFCNTNAELKQQSNNYDNTNNLLSSTAMIKPNREHKAIWTIEELDEIKGELISSLNCNPTSKLEEKSVYNENQYFFYKDGDVHHFVDYLATIDADKRTNDIAAAIDSDVSDNYDKVFIDFDVLNDAVGSNEANIEGVDKSVDKCIDDDDNDYNGDADDYYDSVFETKTAKNSLSSTFTTDINNSNNSSRQGYRRRRNRAHVSAEMCRPTSKAAQSSCNIVSSSVADLTICNNDISNDGGKPQQQQEEQVSLVCHWTDCNKVFTHQVEFVTHIEKRHVDVRKGEDFSCFWVNCPRRYKPFNARYKLLIHMRVHSGEKPNKCPFPSCNKAFSRLENLKIHQRSHTGERPYGCQYKGCLKAFSNSSDRAKHQRTHYDTKPYYCQLPGCTKRYTDPSSLRKHVKNHTLRNANGYTGRRKSANSSVNRKARGNESDETQSTSNKTRRHSETSLPFCTISENSINVKQFSENIININGGNNKLQQNQQRQQRQQRSISCSEIMQHGPKAMKTEIEIYTHNVIMPGKSNCSTNSIRAMPIQIESMANNSNDEACRSQVRNCDNSNKNNSMNFNELSNCIVTIEHNQNENSIDDENDYKNDAFQRNNSNSNSSSHINSANVNTTTSTNNSRTNANKTSKASLGLITTVDALLTTEMNTTETDVCNSLNFNSNSSNGTHSHGNGNRNNNNTIESINQLNGLQHLLTPEAATASTTRTPAAIRPNHNEWNSYRHMITVNANNNNVNSSKATKNTNSLSSCNTNSTTTTIDTEEFVSFEYVKKLLTENFMEVDHSPFESTSATAAAVAVVAAADIAVGEGGKNCQNITTVARCNIDSEQPCTMSANDVDAPNLLLAQNKAANDCIDNINIQNNSSGSRNISSSITNTNGNTSANTIVITNIPCSNINTNMNTNTNDNDICVAAQDFANNFGMDYLNSFM